MAPSLLVSIARSRLQTQLVKLKKKKGVAVPKPDMSYRTRSQIVDELHACIGCNECLLACPALAEPLRIDILNQETIAATISAPVARFARSCYQCGACVAPCPVGLHRDSMMLWLKVRLLREAAEDY
jgi:Na+-translocating ferredoxin:NAD+ oxidoreductase RnfC subunit